VVPPHRNPIEGIVNAPATGQTSWARLALSRLHEQLERQKTGYFRKPRARHFATPEQHKRKRWGAGWDRTLHPSAARKVRLGMTR